jgi:4'-phosphopantetheinyl transferase
MNSLKTRAYIARADELYDECLFGRLYAMASQSRRDKIDRMYFNKDKCLSLAAELLLRQALTDMGTNSFDIEIGDSGKPYLKGSDICFNLSHSEQRAMCVVSPYEVGCDVERVTDIDMELPKRFFCKSEYERLIGISDYRAKCDMFFRLWTLKESYVKLIGAGMSIPPRCCEIGINEDNTAFLKSTGGEKYYFKEYSRNDGYRYAVCTLSEEFSELRLISLSTYDTAFNN